MFQQSEAFNDKLKEMEEKIKREQEKKEREIAEQMHKLEREKQAMAEAQASA